ncbi:MAG: hypothetical protein QOD92_1969 [Acidimicrobiaceae bacterium]|jgi:hypothetical protein
MTTPHDERLDHLDETIEQARKQAQQDGLIPDEDREEPRVDPADPVGLPDPDDDAT